MAIVVIAVMVTIPVAVAITVPPVIMIKPPSRAVPIAVVEFPALMARSDPVGAGIGGPSPITRVPAVVISDGIPVTVYPNEIRPWPRR